jgi:hypothetical protein
MEEVKKQGMESFFVPYEIALALKKLGFDEICIAYYDENKEHYYFISPYLNINDDNVNTIVLAPTFSQAFAWFRDKYNLVHTVYSNASGYIWELHYNQERGGTHICDSGESGDCEMSGMFTTYEKAELECLKKLIEIVKQK